MGRALMAGLHHLAIFHRPALSSAGAVGKMDGSGITRTPEQAAGANENSRGI